MERGIALIAFALSGGIGFAAGFLVAVALLGR